MRRTAARPFPALALVLLLGCGSASSGATTSPSAASQTPPVSVPPTQSTAPTPSASATPAKAEGRIVFYDDRSASPHQQIYIEDADGTNVRRLVVSQFDDAKPVLSPDGRKVAFTRYTPDGAPRADGGVFVMNVDGSGLRQLDTDGEDVSWSPDGTQLVETRALFSKGATAPYNVALWVMNADGTAAHQVTLKGATCVDTCANGAQDNRAVWSRDGKRLLFTRDTYTSPEQFALFTVAIDGSDLRRVTPVGFDVDDAAWSPDGTLIAFQSPPEANQGGEQNIYVIQPDGKASRQLTAHMSSSDGKQGTNHASWSPNGSQILFSHNPGMNGVADLFVMNRDGSDLHMIAPTSLNENGPAWGPIASN